MKKLLCGALFLCLPLAYQAAAAAPITSGKITSQRVDSEHILPGKWTTTIHMIMPGMPFTPAPRTFSNCVTAAEAQVSMQQMVSNLLGPECTLEDFSSSDGSAGKLAHWHTTCVGKHAKKGTGTLTLINAKHYQLASKVMLLDVGGTMQINSEAKWQGSCR